MGIWLKRIHGRRGARHGTRAGWLLVAAGLADDGADKALADLNLGVVGDAHDETVVLHVGDGAVNAAGRHDFVTGAEGGEHLLVLLLLLALRRDHQEIHRGKQQAEKHELGDPGTGGRTGRLGEKGKRVGREGHFHHCVLRVLKKENMHPNGFPSDDSKP